MRERQLLLDVSLKVLNKAGWVEQPDDHLIQANHAATSLFTIVLRVAPVEQRTP